MMISSATQEKKFPPRSAIIPISEILPEGAGTSLLERDRQYDTGLAELISQVVTANPREFSALLHALRYRQSLADQFGEQLRLRDWEKALFDEGHFQFAQKHRPLIEIIINAIDTQLRRDKKLGVDRSFQRKVGIDLYDGGFCITDDGEGMDLKTIVTHLLIPKITGNQDLSAEAVGRFGVGFYSVLSYLKTDQDRVIITTRTVNADNRTEGWQIILSKKTVANEGEVGTFQVSFLPLTEEQIGALESAGVKTRLEVKAQTLAVEEMAAYLEDVLKYKSNKEAELLVSTPTEPQKVLNDTNDLLVHERQFSTEGEGSIQKARLIRAQSVSTSSQVCLAVGGVVVERFHVNGHNLPVELVLDLPVETPLPKSRDKVELNKTTIVATLKLMTAVFHDAMSPHERAGVINGIYPLIVELQKRNPFPETKLNLENTFHNNIRFFLETAKNAEVPILPYSSEVGVLDLPNAIFLDTRLLRKNDVFLPGMSPHLFSNLSFQLYQVPFMDQERVLVKAGSLLLINKELNLGDFKVQTLVSQLLKIYNLSVDSENRVIGKLMAPSEAHVVEERQLTLPSSEQPRKTVENSSRFKRSNSELELVAKEICDRYPLLFRVKRSGFDEQGELLNPDELRAFYAQQIELWQKHSQKFGPKLRKKIFDTFYPVEKASAKIISRFFPRVAKSLVGDDHESLIAIQNIIDRENISYDVSVDSLPTSPDQIREMWLVQKISDAVILCGTDYDENLWDAHIRRTQVFTPSNDPSFWREVVAKIDIPNFLKWIMEVEKSEDMVDELVKILPSRLLEMIHSDLSDLRAYEVDFTMSSSESMKEFFDLLVEMGHKLGELELSVAERLALGEMAMKVVVLKSTRAELSVYRDDVLLQRFVRGGANEGVIRRGESFNPAYSEFQRYSLLKRDFSYGEENHSNFYNPHILLANFFDINSLYSSKMTLGRILLKMESQDRLRFMDWFTDFNKSNKSRVLSSVVSRRLGDLHGLEPRQDIRISYITSDIHLYEGVQTEEDMSIFEKNAQIIFELFDDPDARECYFFDPLRNVVDDGRSGNNLTTIFNDNITFLFKRKLDKSNLLLLSKQAQEIEFPDSSSKQNCLLQIVYFAHLPPELFQKYIMTFLEKYRNFTNVSESDGGWDLTKNGRSVLASLESSELAAIRHEQFAELPGYYIEFFMAILSNIVKRQEIKPISEFRDQYLQVNQKLMIIFRDISRKNPNEAKEIMKGLLSASASLAITTRGVIKKEVEVDRNIRPYLVYLLSVPEMESALLDNIEVNESKATNITGSEMVSYFVSSETQEGLLPRILRGQDTLPKVSGIARELGQRRIEHAVNYQAPENYAWLRELVQNSYNATRGQSEPVVEINRAIGTNRVMLQVKDNVGIPLVALENLFIPQVSGWDKTQDVIGYFGHGFFTVFKHADEVRLKTSDGSGQVAYIEVKILRDKAGGRVLDLSYSIEVKQEEYKGTVITWMKETDAADLELQKAKSELVSYTSLMPASDIKILWSGEVLNAQGMIMSQVETPQGPLRFLKIAGETLLTQRGLMVKRLDSSILAMMPVLARKVLSKQGFAIDIPSSVRLIDSRNDIASRESILPTLAPAIAEASLRAVFEQFIQGNIEIAALPYDFDDLDELLRGFVRLLPQIREDARAIVNGGGVKNWEMYTTSEARGLQLMFSLPIFQFQGSMKSFYEIIWMVNQQRELLEHVPELLMDFITRLLARSKDNIDGIDSERREKNILSDFESELLPERFNVYKAWIDFYDLLLKPATAKYGPQIVHTWYAENNRSIAHALHDRGLIGWNLVYAEAVISAFAEFVNGTSDFNDHPSVSEIVLDSIADTGSHEYQHLVEKIGEVLTHNQEFYQGQRLILETVIAKTPPSRFKEIFAELRAKYGKITYESPSEVIAWRQGSLAALKS